MEKHEIKFLGVRSPLELVNLGKAEGLENLGKLPDLVLVEQDPELSIPDHGKD